MGDVAPEGFGGPYDIQYRGRKPSRISAALGRCGLRCEPDFAAGEPLTTEAPLAAPSLATARLMFCYDPSRRGRAMKQPFERRLAAILAADMAGYSRLMGLDEAGTAQALREHEPPPIR